MSSVTLKVLGVEYVIPKMNIGQLKKMSTVSASAGNAIERGVQIVNIAGARAVPVLILGDDMEIDIDDVNELVVAITALNRRPKPAGEENPPAP